MPHSYPCPNWKSGVKKNGHLICLRCLVELLSRLQNCPTCRGDFDESNTDCQYIKGQIARAVVDQQLQTHPAEAEFAFLRCHAGWFGILK